MILLCYPRIFYSGGGVIALSWRGEGAGPERWEADADRRLTAGWGSVFSGPCPSPKALWDINHLPKAGLSDFSPGGPQWLQVSVLSFRSAAN